MIALCAQAATRLLNASSFQGDSVHRAAHSAVPQGIGMLLLLLIWNLCSMAKYSGVSGTIALVTCECCKRQSSRMWP